MLSHAPSAAEVLTIWEECQGRHPVDLVLTLLAAAVPDTPVATLAATRIGERDGLLLTLRDCLFGPSLRSMVDCPACAECLELDFSVDEVLGAGQAPSAAAADAEGAVRPSEARDWAWGEYRLSFRAPNSFDQLAAGLAPSLEAAERILLARCVTEAQIGGDAVDPVDLPEPLIRALGEAMLAADPQAEIQTDLSCPNCGHAWQAPFDIVAYLASEVETWARRLLGEVHVLARAYGWREADVLALSPARRQAYLQMALA